VEIGGGRGDFQDAVVLGHAFAAGRGTGLEVAAAGADGQVGNEVVFGFAGAVRDDLSGSPSRRSTASREPVEAPDGTPARAVVPSASRTVTARVGRPCPNSTTGPNSCSSSTLIVASTPPVIIGWMMTLVRRSPKASSSERNPRRTSSAPCRSSRTAPAPFRRTTRSGTSALRATGTPDHAAAAAAAAPAVVTAMLSASGTS
jgi:hypothetical protein